MPNEAIFARSPLPCPPLATPLPLGLPIIRSLALPTLSTLHLDERGFADASRFERPRSRRVSRRRSTRTDSSRETYLNRKPLGQRSIVTVNLHRSFLSTFLWVDPSLTPFPAIGSHARIAIFPYTLQIRAPASVVPFCARCLSPSLERTPLNNIDNNDDNCEQKLVVYAERIDRALSREPPIEKYPVRGS